MEKDNPAVFGMSVVESQSRTTTIFGNVTLTSKSSYRGSQYAMLSDLRGSNADVHVCVLGLCFFFRQKAFSILSSRFYHNEKQESIWFIVILSSRSSVPFLSLYS